MYSSIPNMAQTFGYINASWTLRADLTAEYVCRLLNHMDAVGASVVTPTLRPEDHNMPARDWIEDFTPGYMQRMMHLFPKQGYGPWCNTQNYRLDKRMIRKAPIEDDALVFQILRPQRRLSDTKTNSARFATSFFTKSPADAGLFVCSQTLD